METPFFVIGPQRSGTTLLRLILSNHPRLCIPPESHFIPELVNWEKSCGNLNKEKSKVISWLKAHSRLEDFQIPTEKLLLNLDKFTSKNIINAIFEEYAKRQGKVRWGDKTPRYRGYVKEILTLFPQAKFIFIYRDGRDTALSNYQVPFGPKLLSDGALLWKNSMIETKINLAQVPRENVLELKYEEIVSCPQKNVKKVCVFLQEKYTPEMLSFYKKASNNVPAWEKSWHSNTRKPVDKSNMYKWKSQLAPYQITLIELLVGKELKNNGYILSKGKVSFFDIFKILKELILLLIVKLVEYLRPNRSRIGDQYKNQHK